MSIRKQCQNIRSIVDLSIYMYVVCIWKENNMICQLLDTVCVIYIWIVSLLVLKAFVKIWQKCNIEGAIIQIPFNCLKAVYRLLNNWLSLALNFFYYLSNMSCIFMMNFFLLKCSFLLKWCNVKKDVCLSE